MKRGLIYKITNPTNKKCYVGQTTQGLRQRKKEHFCRFKRFDRPHKIYLAFKKYGFEHFEWSVLEKRLDIEGLNRQEQHYIQEYDSFENGYNMTIGGDTVSEETRAKLSRIFKGRKITWKDKLVKSWKDGYTKERHPFYKVYGSDNPLSKKYIVVEPDGTEHLVDGIGKWCRDWNKTHPDNKLYAPNFTNCARGRQQQYKGFRCVYSNEREKLDTSKFDWGGEKRSLRWVVTEPDGTEHRIKNLQRWCREWKKDYLQPNNLNLCAQGKHRSHKGYKCRRDDLEPSTTIPTGSTPQAIGGGNGEGLRVIRS